MSDYWKEWLRAAGIRTIRTFAETALGIIGTSVLLEQVSWIHVLSASVLSAIICVLTALAGLPEISASKKKRKR